MTRIWLCLGASQVQHFADDKTHVETKYKNKQIGEVNMDISGFVCLGFFLVLEVNF